MQVLKTSAAAERREKLLALEAQVSAAKTKRQVKEAIQAMTEMQESGDLPWKQYLSLNATISGKRK